MSDDDRLTGSGRLTRVQRPAGVPPGLLIPLVLGLVLGTAVAIYAFWSHTHDQHLAETVADPGMGGLPAQECAIAKAAIAAFHTSGQDARQSASVGAKEMTLKAHSLVVNPTDVPGYDDDEADDVRGKPKADWRACAGMGDFVRGLKWIPLSDDIDSAELSVSRPGVNTAGDEAKVYESFSGPTPDNHDATRETRGPWLLTLKKGANGTWVVAATADAPRH
jgi:hypothetical protein